MHCHWSRSVEILCTDWLVGLLTSPGPLWNEKWSQLFSFIKLQDRRAARYRESPLLSRGLENWWWQVGSSARNHFRPDFIQSEGVNFFVLLEKTRPTVAKENQPWNNQTVQAYSFNLFWLADWVWQKMFDSLWLTDWVRNGSKCLSCFRD